MIFAIIAAAFFAGVITSQPFAEAAGGWKEALEALRVDLQSQIDNIQLIPGPPGEDGTIINVKTLPTDTGCGLIGPVNDIVDGWCPDNIHVRFLISDPDVTEDSLILITLFDTLSREGTVTDCTASPDFRVGDASFLIGCTSPPRTGGLQLNYAVIP